MVREVAALLDRVRHLCSEVWDAACLLLGALVDISVWTIASARVYAQFIVLAMVYVAFLLGVSPWVMIIPPITPLFAVWLWVQVKRERNHLALLLDQQKEWDIDKALKGYTELLEKQRKGERTSLVKTHKAHACSLYPLLQP